MSWAKGHKFVQAMHADAKDFFLNVYVCTECGENVAVKTFRKGRKPEVVSEFEACPKAAESVAQ